MRAEDIPAGEGGYCEWCNTFKTRAEFKTTTQCRLCATAKRAEYSRANPSTWGLRNPERRAQTTRAASAVHNAILRGELERPAACEECGVACHPDAAHRDYDQPFDVRWLCRTCHAKWDHAEPKTK